MHAPCQGLRPGDPPCGHPYPHALFQPLPPQPALFPGIFLNTIPGNKGVYLTTGDTLRQAIPLSHIHNMAMGPRVTDTNRPRASLAGRGANDQRPTDPKAPGPDRAILHLTMEPTAKLPNTLVRWAQISATTNRGCWPWVGPLLGVTKHGAGFCTPPPHTQGTATPPPHAHPGQSPSPP